VFARLTLLEIDTLRMSMSEALDRFERETSPHLRAQPGYRGVFVLSTPEGRGALLSLWESEQQARDDGEHGFYGEALQSFATFFRSPPGRECYEVVFVDEPNRSAVT
jgi:hypothetical protein